MIHRKTVHHYHEPGHLHELTFSCYSRLPLLTDDARRATLAECIDLAGQEMAISPVGFVFMPEHVHLLVYPTLPNRSISLYLARIKQPCSKQIKLALEGQQSPLLSRLSVRERPGKTCFRFWQEGPGFDRNLFSPRAIELTLEYLHNNPVRRGLCVRPEDWLWSSARYYLRLPAVDGIRLPRIDGLPEGSLR